VGRQNLPTGNTSKEADMADIITNLAGVTFGDCQKFIRECREHGIRFCTVNREPENPCDQNAVSIRVGGTIHLGYVPQALAASIAKEIDSGNEFEAEIRNFNQFDDNGTIGLTVRIFPRQFC
jgi:hypothetical protein